MKIAIIAASLFASASAMAVTDSGVMNFRAVSEPVITLNVTNGDAVLNTGEVFTSDHVATAKISSNLDTPVLVSSVGTWSDLSAFGGVAPSAHLIQTTFRGVDGDIQNNHRDANAFEERYNLKAGVEHDYLMSVRTTAMTHVGAAEYQAIIQVSAE